MQRTARAALFAAVLGGLAACSTLPPPPHLPPTSAIEDFAQTPLAQLLATVLPTDGRSGFRLQPYGPNSFGTRTELSRLATRSLDVQYYLLPGDQTGLSLMRALRDAAVRGVRVRLLIDDLYTAGEDDLLLGLASYPNVEVRLFNPFPGGRALNLTRLLSSGLELARIDRRMHNKLFIADNIAAVAGGRNMADEYVQNIDGRNFVDMDTFAAGPVVQKLSAAFDRYWNSEAVFPVAAIAGSASSAAELRRAFEQRTARAEGPTAYEVPADGTPGHPDGDAPVSLSPELADMLNLPFELANGRLTGLLPANARVLFDPPSKTEGWNEAHDSIEGTVTGGVLEWFRTARSNIKMVSPYFVPGDKGVAGLLQARAAGITVELITNSLASTDEPLVYVGYFAHVRPLLAAGIQISEISPTLSVERRHFGIFGHRAGALHMKNAIVDHRQVFLGSMNLDQRSAELNTELGLIIDSAEMAQQLERFGDAGSAYRLRIGAGGAIEWVGVRSDGTPVVYDAPPETTAWQRFRLRLMSPFVPEKEL